MKAVCRIDEITKDTARPTIPYIGPRVKKPETNAIIPILLDIIGNLPFSKANNFDS